MVDFCLLNVTVDAIFANRTDGPLGGSSAFIRLGFSVGSGASWSTPS